MMRDALPLGIAENRSFTSTSFVPSQRARASVMTPAGPPPRPPAAGGVAPGAGAGFLWYVM
jgi:hypothetical protein